MEYGKTGKDWALRVLIDHPDGITLDHCQSVTLMIREMLEEEDPIKQEDYHIEISSPGVDRPLIKLKDYQRFLNERVYVKAHRAIEGAKQFTGELLFCSEEAIEISNEHDGQTYRIPLDEIAKATLKPILNF